VLRADAHGLSVAYERAGHGPGLVLLHGFLFDSRAPVFHFEYNPLTP
jgi:pimeloyl-ACP methyl ester carboxylesterase